MAVIETDYALDMGAFDFYQVTSHADATDFYDNGNLTFNGVTYSDVLAIQWHDGNDYLSVLGGNNFTQDSSGAITGGTATGYLLEDLDQRRLGAVLEPSGHIGVCGVALSSLSNAQHQRRYGDRRSGDGRSRRRWRKRVCRCAEGLFRQR